MSQITFTTTILQNSVHRMKILIFKKVQTYEVVVIILASRLPLVWSSANRRNADTMACPVSSHTFVCGSFPFLEVIAEPDL